MSRVLIILVLAAISANAHYNGSCDPHCEECYGPGADQCSSCCNHADFEDGICVCEEGYYGTHCQYWSGECHDLCNGCVGPAASDCKYCITNASLDDFGHNCVCDDGWSGEYCMDYIGHGDGGNQGCDLLCDGCHGEGADSCVMCVNHAHFDSRGFCVCDEYWCGAACSEYDYSNPYGEPNDHPDSHDEMTLGYDMFFDDYDNELEYYEGCYDGYQYKGHYHGGISGECHPTCSGGCAGPHSSDCNSCNEHSYYYDGCCVCMDGYYHYDCMTNYDDYTPYYGGVCHGTCGGYCYGPDACDCEVCGSHAHENYWGYCICDDGYYGHDCSHYADHVHSHYDGYCSPMCDGCYGPDDYDCMRCPGNAYIDAYGYCCCYDGYYGDHCDMTYEQYTCAPTCTAGCSGSTARDCTACVAHSHYTDRGCTCDDEWGGDDCSLYEYYQYQYYDGPCDPICNGCTGTDPTECEECNKNAHWDKTGRCVCDMNWVGDDCGTWDYEGKCAKKCEHCVGPNPQDCVTCSSNAVWNDREQCDCLPYWSGDNCETQVYRGSCDSKCIGCKGPAPNECLSCVANATLNQYGYCICNSYWSGNSCENWQSGCDPKCRTCNGPLASDCDVCVPNAHWDLLGFCVCDEDHAGPDCETWIGSCFHTCDTCSGPNACDCSYCVANAHYSEDGETCECDDYWIGEGCENYVGPCDPICNGCVGPESCHCEHCVHHAHKNTHDDCVCDDYWSGSDCSVFKGFCDDKCDGCYGPRACDCEKCAKNAYFDNHGYCICEREWSSDFCLEYVGRCDGYCDQELGCFGPSHKDCKQCAENAHRAYDGFCQCDEDWGGDDCSEYTGECDPVCEGCHGPNSKDCEKCVENADDVHGDCICIAGWSGADCHYWTGGCFPTCHACVGPEQGDCYDCVNNASRDQHPAGHCMCDTDWHGASDCSIYSGVCDHRCLSDHGCTSPSNVHCDDCTDNAHRENVFGGCVCNEGWSGEGCKTWGGECDPRCEFGCSGPSNSHCTQCVANAIKHDGACECMHGWDHIEDCSEYHELCAGACNRCNGPEPDECYECAEHAKRNHDGLCECEEHWHGDRCTEFDQDQCQITCTSCNGPGLYDCLDCVDNAHRDYQGSCVCDSNWGEKDCSLYSGQCHLRCSMGCSGPTDMHCNACVYNASLVDKHCECDAGWTGDDCSIWQGVCHDRCQGCVGPKATDCVICAPNAYRIGGECVCQHGFENISGTENCMKEIIVCHVSCSHCNGTKQNECVECHTGFFLSLISANAGFCLPCAEECRTCTGFDSNQCTGCYEGKTTVDGTCHCCHASCETCHGPGSGQCNSCYADATKMANGHCHCNNGKVRDPWTFGCVDRCPFGYTANHDSQICTYDANIESRLSMKTNQSFHDQGNGGLDFTESCHMPAIRGNMIFDGKSTLGVKNFIPPKDFRVEFWVRAENITTLFSLEMEVWNEAEARKDEESTCQLADKITRKRIKYDIWLDSCHKAIIARWMDYEPAVTQNTQYDMTHQWVHVAIHVNSKSDNSIDLEVVHHSEGKDAATVLMTDRDLSIAYDIDAKMYFGSLLGYAQKNEGRLDGIVIHTRPTQVNAAGRIDHINCNWNEYVTERQRCKLCDPSCTHGCNDAGVCMDCHESCAECNHDEANPGSIDECTACYCGAELVNGRCQCGADYYGPANDCQLKCSEGCEHCVGTGENECYICEENYELLPAAPGTCHWCSENECDEDGMPSCGTRGLVTSECDCTAGQWYDGKFCRNCADGCAVCNSIGVCEACEEGLYRFGAFDGCFDYCPFGFAANGDVCEPKEPYYDVFNFDFTPTEDGLQVWDFSGFDNSWNVRVFGGLQQEKENLEEPFIFEDRGAWFDGKYDLMTFVLLKLPSFLTYNFWSKTHSDGVLFAGNMAHNSHQGGYYMGINDGQVEFVGIRKPSRDITPLVVRTNSTVVEYFEWSYIQVSLERMTDHDETAAKIYYNTKLELATQFGPVYDFPEPKMTHTIGASYQDHTLVKHFRGFLSSVSNTFGLKESPSYVAMDCDGFCSICRGDDGHGECFGSCNWNHFWNWAEEKCQRCPLWCRQGCNTRGAC